MISIIVPIKDGIEFINDTLNCLSKFTDVEHEIIIVDDCSDKETANFIDDFCKDKNNVVLLRNDTTLGYVKSCNIGIKNAKGDVIVLMNSDVIVCENWASELTKYFDIEDVVLIGTKTNYAFSESQKVNIEFSSIDDFLEKAKKFNEENKGTLIFTPRVVGFCLAFKRSLIDEIGLFDERFSPGNFEDDDFCLRTVIAGHRPAVAGDVLLWHLGSKTFGKDRVTFSKILKTNEDVFSKKWNTLIVTDKSINKNLPTISVSMIVKNEQNNLKELLQVIRYVADEIVIVDTGSNDNTIRIAKKYADKVLKFNWNNDFSAARNYGLEHCTKEYILWLDADDRITIGNIFNLKIHLMFFPNTAVFVKLVDKQINGEFVSLQLRVFPNNKNIRFSGKVHEQVSYSVEAENIKYSRADVSILHTGYSSKEAIIKKYKRNLELLEQEDKNDVTVNINLARTYFGLGEIDKSLYYNERAINLYKNNDCNISKETILLAYIGKMNCLSTLYINSNKNAIISFIKEGFTEINHPVFNKLASIMAFVLKDYTTAYEMSKDLLDYKIDLSTVPLNVNTTNKLYYDVVLFSSLYAGDFSTTEKVAQKILEDKDFKIRRK